MQFVSTCNETRRFNLLLLSCVKLQAERPDRVRVATATPQTLPCPAIGHAMTVDHRPPGFGPLGAASEPTAAPAAPSGHDDRQACASQRPRPQGYEILNRGDEHGRVSRK